MEEQARVVGALEGAISDRGTRTLEVTVIRPGTSANGYRYSAAVLEAGAPLWEGAAAFCDHPGPLDRGRAGGRSVRDLVGVYGSPRYVAGRGVVAELRVYPSAAWLVELVEAHLADETDGKATARLGISADQVVAWEPAREGGRSIKDVRRIVRVVSGDVVMHPSAGGRFDRILESASVARAGEEGSRAAATTAALEEAELEEEKGPGQEHARMVGAHGELALCGALLTAKLGSSGLPERAQAHVRRRFEGRVFEAAELDREVEGIRGILAAQVAGSVIAGAGAGRPRVSATLSSREKVQAALDRLFGVELPSHLSSVPRLSGIREAYVAITGDRLFTGYYHPEESVLEANEVTTAVMADALADTINKRLVKDYRGQPRWWERIAVRVPLNDMRTQTRVLLNDFASLADVAENGAYANVAWGDAKETYTPAKKGNLVYVTMEMIINDDVRAVTRIPAKLALAATVTINEVVSALFTANAGVGPTMADTNNVFHAAHGNTSANALSAANLQTAMIAMAKQTSSASKRLGLIGKHLLVPPDLIYTAQVICGTPLVPGSANNDVNPLAGQVEPIAVPNWTDVNNWYLLADPAQIESVEVGFLNGREEPEIMVQDNPTAGSVFTNDAITFKVRHIYGAGWLDYRGAYGAIVA